MTGFVAVVVSKLLNVIEFRVLFCVDPALDVVAG